MGGGVNTFHASKGGQQKLSVHSSGTVKHFTITEHFNPPPPTLVVDRSLSSKLSHWVGAKKTNMNINGTSMIIIRKRLGISTINL